MIRLQPLLVRIAGVVLALLVPCVLALSPTLTAPVTEAESSDWLLLLNVPYRSQMDGSPAAGANCGIAALGMVLEAYGVEATNGQLRERADQVRGSTNPDEGVALDHLQQIAEEAGLVATGLRDGRSYARWTMGDLRLHLEQGHPVITLVHYRSLPGNEQSLTSTDHYIVVVGYSTEGFVVDDPASSGDSGRWQTLTDEQLQQAWDAASIPGHAMAILPGEGYQPVAVARLLESELELGVRPLAFSGAEPLTLAGASTPVPEPSPTETAEVSPGRLASATPTRSGVRSGSRWARASQQPTAVAGLWAAGWREAGESVESTAASAAVANMPHAPANHLYGLGIVVGAVLAGWVLLRRR